MPVLGNDLQNSGEEEQEEEEEEDFGGVDLVEEIPTEVGASKPVSPEENLSSHPAENYATTEGSNGPSDEMQPANQGCAEMKKLNNQRGRILLSRTCGLGRTARGDRHRF